MRELTQSADGAAVGLVAQSVCAGVAETQVSAGQDERVTHVRQTHHTLGAVVADLVVGHLERGTKKTLLLPEMFGRTICFTARSRLL